ncbi:adhesion G protein-coupled receptor A3-like [Agrilus planipennis]|uniref:Adhesion G protein-coupled receptor A3 n=1 Tax=Agrilus planipennis TaxID=224129 RepID=A0A1W4XDJ2_AGRPL|nr:adhesion G protein-coupled receptor A3 [Agrilus planipennis]XP_025832323.1 adhesion G protein-coupled receptor A3-like [Agrilus planipennis]
MKILYLLNSIGLLLINIINPLLSVNTCPEKCLCREVPQKDKLVWTKLRCGDTEKIKHLDELDLLNIANEILYLNLSDNYLTNFSPKIQFLALQRLDLSKNKIEALQNKQFEEVPNLRRLDISNNLIKLVEPQAFAGLKYLERLKLNQNLISTIQKGTFKTLTFLKQLDISNNPLTCDCELLWLLEWTQQQSVKIASNPKCSSPATFKGVPLRKLKIGTDIHCKSPADDKEIPMIDLHLRNDQILFEGDSFRLKCISPFIPDTYQSETETKSDLLWFWESSQKDVIRSFHTNNYFYSEKGLIESEIIIPKINQNYSGLLYCQRTTDEGNFTKAINLIIISKNSQFCEMTTTLTNKGNYYWPKTLTNNTVYLPCEFIQVNVKVSEQQASYYCSSEGQWENLNTSNCTYTSEITRTLEQFSKLNLSLNLNIYERARHFKNFTSNLRLLKDVMDLVFLVRTIENYIPYLSFDKELGNILIDIINLLMTLPENYLRKADEIDGSLDKIVKVIEDIVSHNTTSSLHKNNIVAEEFSIKKEAFVGMTCSWYSSAVNNSDRMFYCVTSSSPTVTTGIMNKKIDASVQIPASLFSQLKEQEEPVDTEEVQRLLVVMMANGKLFSLDESLKGSKAITLPVIGVKLANNTAVSNLTEPIYIMLRIPTTYYDSTASIPVWWDPEANEGRGNWTSEGCQFSHEIRENLIFSCKNFGYYAFLEDVTKYNVIETGAKFKLSHPAIYIGSFVLFSCLLITITTYAFCYVSIQMPKKAKHSLINLWIVIMMLVYIYVFGIYQTEDTFLCQIVGIVLHYLTLSSLLWVVVGVSTMYRRLNKSDAIDLNEDELPSDQPIQKPILGLYLVGWGVALIVCGISSAVNMKEYAAYDFCFLNSPPALSALFIPTVILYALLGILFLLIRCTIYNTDVNGHLSEGTQATENVDLDLLEPSFQTNDRHSILSVKTRSSEIEDQEHSPSAQLKAQVIFLLIYTVAWFCCAFATSTPFHLEHEAEIFSILYAVFASLLGGFTFFFYCVARSDIRSRWLSCKRSKTAYFRTRNVSDTSQNIQIQSLPLPSVSNQNGEAQVTSRSSSRSSTKTKSNSNNSNLLKAVTNVKATAAVPNADKINNMNLVLLHTQQYRIGIPVPNIIENPASSVQMFYNPYQSTVARKFFRKQRQHMMKRNNFPVRKCDSDTTSVISVPKSNNDAEQNIFGTSSKVNNTNIHVERIKRSKHRNPNIYSDSCEDLSLPLDKMAINSERTRRREYPRHRTKKKQNVARSKEALETPDMRTVSQQCSLEYTSDTSALDVAQMPLDTFELPQTVDEDKLSLSPAKSVELKVTFPPTNFKRAQSRASSFSASELDELYQQIRRGNGSTKVKQKGHLRCHSPWLSDSEIHSYAGEAVKKARTIYSLDEFDDNVETTV